MSTADTFFLFYCVLAVGLFTAAWMIAFTYTAVMGIRTLRERLRLGEEYQKEYGQMVAQQYADFTRKQAEDEWLKKQEGR